MATVADILNFVETLAPRSMKMDWDNVGLNVGHRDKEVKKILVALDPFSHVCREAKDWGADLLVTHHVLIFRPGFVTDATAQGRNTLFLIENGIAHINAHTNLDLAPGGVNDCLAARLGLENPQVINPMGVDADGREWGLLRCGTVQKQAFPEFLAHVKNALGCEGLRFVDAGKPVRKVASGGGSCCDEMQEAVDAGCDTFVTSDAKYNDFWDAYDLGLNLIDAGHFYTENPVTGYLAEKIADAFPEITVKISETHHDCMKFY
nr:Nif3-like dinuclear metal center hexameric protein [Oscillospiraceae bacterium]